MCCCCQVMVHVVVFSLCAPSCDAPSHISLCARAHTLPFLLFGRMQVPLLLTVYAVVSFKAFHLLQQQPQGATTGSSSSNKSSQQSPQPAPADDFFSVPEGYKRRKLQDVMEKSAKNTFGDFGGGGSNPWGADDEDDDDDFFGGGGGGGGGRGSGGSYVWPGSGLGGGGGGGSRRPAPAVFYGGDAGAEYLTEEDVSGMGGAGR